MREFAEHTNLKWGWYGWLEGIAIIGHPFWRLASSIEMDVSHVKIMGTYKEFQLMNFSLFQTLTIQGVDYGYNFENLPSIIEWPPIYFCGHKLFIKWVEAVPLKKTDQGNVINFVEKNIIHRFGIPLSITIDQGDVFTRYEMKEFTEDCGIKLINSYSHYPQSSGHAGWKDRDECLERREVE